MDVSTFPDLDPSGSQMTDPVQALGEIILRRLTTWRGALWYDFDFGLDLRERLNDDLGPRELALLKSDIRDEVEKDERVKAADVELELNYETNSLKVMINVDVSDATYKYIVSVDQVNASFLAQEAA